MSALQASALSALGVGIVFDDGSTSDGTSFSAPAIAAAAAFVSQATGSVLAPRFLRRALTRSARRTFFEATGDGNTGVWHCETEAVLSKLEAEFAKDARVLCVPFDPSRYGAGIMDVGEAARYARCLLSALTDPANADEHTACEVAEAAFRSEKRARLRRVYDVLRTVPARMRSTGGMKKQSS